MHDGRLYNRKPGVRRGNVGSERTLRGRGARDGLRGSRERGRPGVKLTKGKSGAALDEVPGEGLRKESAQEERGGARRKGGNDGEQEEGRRDEVYTAKAGKQLAFARGGSVFATH